MTDVGSLFRLDPDKGAFVASYGPKGSGKSELNKRLFKGYPYDGLLIDHAGDADDRHEWTEPFPGDLTRLLPELDRLAESNMLDDLSLAALQARIFDAWHQGEPGRPRKYRIVPNFLSDEWLEQTDRFIGLAYVMGRACVLLDEMNLALPANRTPRFSRTALQVGRHRKLSVLMPGPRPTGIDTLALTQADVSTIHGPLHERDTSRLARQWEMADRELNALCRSLADFEFLAYFRDSRELVHCDALPPEKPYRKRATQ